MSGILDLGKVGLTTGFANSEQERIDYLKTVTSNPNGVITGYKGHFAIDTNSGLWYRNNSAGATGTDWVLWNVDAQIASEAFADVSSVTVTHALNYQYPNVRVVIGGKQVMCEVTYINVSSFRVNFSSNKTGAIYYSKY